MENRGLENRGQTTFFWQITDEQKNVVCPRFSRRSNQMREQAQHLQSMAEELNSIVSRFRT